MRRALATVTALSLAGVVSADEAPNSAVVTPPAVLDSAAPRLDTVTYLGVATAIAPESVRSQLGLQKGIGVLVDYIDPDSPAEKAGLMANDVIHKIDDQFVVNSQQLTVLVRLHAPGDSVTLGVYRKGKPETLKVQLGKRELPRVEEDVALVIPPDLRDDALPRVGGRGTGVITHSDGNNTIIITTREDRRTVEIRDHEGNVLHRGGLNTPADYEKIPAEFRETIARIEANARQFRELKRSRNPDS